MTSFKQKFIQGLCKLKGYQFITAQSFDCTEDWFHIPFYIDDTISKESTTQAFEEISGYLELFAKTKNRTYDNIIGMKVDSKLFFGKLK